MLLCYFASERIPTESWEKKGTKISTDMFHTVPAAICASPLWICIIQHVSNTQHKLSTQLLCRTVASLYWSSEAQPDILYLVVYWQSNKWTVERWIVVQEEFEKFLLNILTHFWVTIGICSSCCESGPTTAALTHKQERVAKKLYLSRGPLTQQQF